MFRGLFAVAQDFLGIAIAPKDPEIAVIGLSSMVSVQILVFHPHRTEKRSDESVSNQDAADEDREVPIEIRRFSRARMIAPMSTSPMPARPLSSSAFRAASVSTPVEIASAD